MSKRRDLLIIDDEQVVLDAVTRVGKAHGYSVDGVTEGVAGLRKLDDESFRLVICDIMMPDMDGFQILEAVRKRHPKTPVVMTTGFSTIEHAVRSLRSGAAAYLAKPFNEEELVSAIQRGMRSASLTGPTPPGSVPAGGTEASGATYLLGWISWVRIEQPGTAIVGVTGTFLKTVGPLKQIHLSEENEELVQGTPCARMTAQDGITHDVLGPISGTIVNVNTHLVDNTRDIERDPFGKGWFYRIIPTDTGYELRQLTSPADREGHTITHTAHT